MHDFENGEAANPAARPPAGRLLDTLPKRPPLHLPLAPSPPIPAVLNFQLDSSRRRRTSAVTPSAAGAADSGASPAMPPSGGSTARLQGKGSAGRGAKRPSPGPPSEDLKAGRKPGKAVR